MVEISTPTGLEGVVLLVESEENLVHASLFGHFTVALEARPSPPLADLVISLVSTWSIILIRKSDHT